MGFTLPASPQVYFVENDISQLITLTGTSLGAIVFASDRGPVGPTLITSLAQFDSLYGPPDPTTSFGHYCIRPFLQAGGSAYVNRVINGSLFAGQTYFNAAVTNSLTDIGSSSVANPAGYGYPTDYTTAPGRQVASLIFSGPITAGQTINTTVTVNGTATVVATAYSTSSLQTMQNFVAAILTALNTTAVGGSVTLTSDPVGNANTMVVVQAPLAAILTLTTTSVSGTGSPATITNTSNAAGMLFNAFAQNPGAWAGLDGTGSNNALGTAITYVDLGTPQRQAITFSTALVTNNVINATVNSVALAPITFATSSNATLAALAAAIQNAVPGSTATVVLDTSGTTSGQRIINFIAPNAISNVSITGVIVTAGTAQPTVQVQETITRIASTGTFKYAVYTSANPSQPIEQWTVALSNQLDGRGNQQNMEFVINSSTAKSNNIRVRMNVALFNTGVVPLSITPVTWFSGGTNGAAVTSGNIVTGWNQFYNVDQYGVRILINGGYSTPDVQQCMLLLAATRKDCFAILDLPSSVQDTTTDALAYRNYTLNANTSYGAIYGPDLYILDEINSFSLYVPPSGFVAAVYATTDSIAVWLAPAGLRRGVLNVLGLRTIWSQSDQNILSPAQINVIRLKPGKGYVIWDCLTLQSFQSALSDVNVRRLVTALEISITDSLEDEEFENISAGLRFNIVQQINDLLEPIKSAGGIYSYYVQCDADNNPDADVDADLIVVDVYIKPAKPTRFIQVNMNITSTGASFTEIAALQNTSITS